MNKEKPLNSDYRTLKEISLFLKMYDLRIKKMFDLYYSVYNGSGDWVTLEKKHIITAINDFLKLNKKYQTDFLEYLNIYKEVLNGYE